MAAEARSIATLPANPLARFALRLFGGVVRTCSAALASGFSPFMLLTLLGAALAVGRAAVRRAPAHPAPVRPPLKRMSEER